MFYELRSVVIKVPHRCFGCDREFNKGTEMNYASWVDSEKWHHGYFCCTCTELCSLYAAEDELEFCQGDFFEDALEYENRKNRKENEATWQTDDWLYCPSCYTRYPVDIYEYDRVGIIKPAEINHCPYCGRRL